MGNLTLHLTFLGLLSIAASSAGAAPVVDSKTGYTLNLPDGWRRLPDEVLRQRLSATLKPGAGGAPQFVAAYEPADHETPFQYPYALVQVHPYGQGISLATISRREIDEMVSKIAGVPAAQLKQAMTDDVASLVGDVSRDTATVTTTPPGFVTGSKMKVAGIGQIRGRSFCLLGRTNAVFLHFYATEADWQQHAGVLEGLASGFRRTADQAVTVGDATRTTSGKKLGGGFDWGRVWTKALVGAVIGGVVGLISWVVKRGKHPGRGR